MLKVHPHPCLAEQHFHLTPAALRALLPTLKPLGGSCRGVQAWGDAGVGQGKRWHGDRNLNAGRVAGRGELRGGTRSAQPAFSSPAHAQLLRGKTGRSIW